MTAVIKGKIQLCLIFQIKKSQLRNDSIQLHGGTVSLM